MADKDSNTPNNPPGPKEELHANIDQIQQLQAEYESLTDQQKAGLPGRLRRFFECSGH